MKRNGQPIYAPDEEKRRRKDVEAAYRDALAPIRHPTDSRIGAIDVTASNGRDHSLTSHHPDHRDRTVINTVRSPENLPPGDDPMDKGSEAARRVKLGFQNPCT